MKQAKLVDSYFFESLTVSLIISTDVGLLV